VYTYTGYRDDEKWIKGDRRRSCRVLDWFAILVVN